MHSTVTKPLVSRFLESFATILGSLASSQATTTLTLVELVLNDRGRYHEKEKETQLKVISL